VNRAPTLYAIRIRGHLGATGLSAFPEMASQHIDDDTVLTGLLQDRSALFALLARVEALDEELRSRPRVPGGEVAEDHATVSRVAEFVITDLDGPRGEPNLPDRIVLGATVGEPLVKVAAFGYGVRKAAANRRQADEDKAVRSELRRQRKAARRS